MNISSQFRHIFEVIGQKLVKKQSFLQLNNSRVKEISNIIDTSIGKGTKKIDKIIEDGSEFLRSPINWLKEMQRTWLIYVICMAIICLCISFFYCAWQGYCSRRRGTDNRLADITMAISKNNNANVNKY
jgi:hypothetical protein